MNDPLFAAGFNNMRVLADHEDPTQACRPFDVNRSGFVMGEGAAMFVLERLDYALDRGAQIYAEILGGRMLSDAHHVTSLGDDSSALVELITGTLQASRIAPHDVAYVNAHGTGTQQNDAMESRGIRLALGGAADSICVSANKSMLGRVSREQNGPRCGAPQPVGCVAYSSAIKIAGAAVLVSAGH